MNSVQKSEHEKNLEHSKKRSRPSLLRPVSAPAKVTVSCECRCLSVWQPSSPALSVGGLGSSTCRPQAVGLGQEAEPGPWSGLKCTSCGSLGSQLTSEGAPHLCASHKMVVRSVTSSWRNQK